MNTQKDDNRLLSRLFGFPIWLEDFEGDLYKRRARRLPDGGISTHKIMGRTRGNADGTFNERSYMKRWYHRDTWFG